MENLEGSWDCVSAVVNGQALPEAVVQSLLLTLTDTRYVTRRGDQVLFDSTYTTDAAQEPKRINMVGTEGALAGKEAEGIYVLEGDSLTMCYTMPGKPRPVAFDSPAGSEAYLIKWRRWND
jgi:uncharacterized protein (TIGR03067 family)